MKGDLLITQEKRNQIVDFLQNKQVAMSVAEVIRLIATFQSLPSLDEPKGKRVDRKPKKNKNVKNKKGS